MSSLPVKRRRTEEVEEEEVRLPRNSFYTCCVNEEDPISYEFLPTLPEEQVFALTASNDARNCYQTCDLNNTVLRTIAQRNWEAFETYPPEATLPSELIRGPLGEPMTKGIVDRLISRAARAGCYQEPISTGDVGRLISIANKLKSQQELNDTDVATLRDDAAVAYDGWQDRIAEARAVERDAEDVGTRLDDARALSNALYAEGQVDLAEEVLLSVSESSADYEQRSREAQRLRDEGDALKERVLAGVLARLTTGVWPPVSEGEQF